MSNVEILGPMSMIFKSQCQCRLLIIDHRQCQCLDFPQWQCQCIEICQWSLTFYKRVYSSDHNVNVNSCIQSLTSLNVNGTLNNIALQRARRVCLQMALSVGKGQWGGSTGKWKRPNNNSKSPPNSNATRCVRGRKRKRSPSLTSSRDNSCSRRRTMWNNPPKQSLAGLSSWPRPSWCSMSPGLQLTTWWSSRLPG